MTDNLNQKHNQTIGETLQELALKLSKQRQLPLRFLSSVNSLETVSPQHQNFAQTIIQQFQPEKWLTMLSFRRQSLPEMGERKNAWGFAVRPGCFVSSQGRRPVGDLGNNELPISLFPYFPTSLFTTVNFAHPSEITRQEPFFEIEGDNFSHLNQTQFLQANGEQQEPKQPQEPPKTLALNPVLTLPIPVIEQQELEPNYNPKSFDISQLLENTPSAVQQTSLNIDNTRLPNQPIVTKIEQQKQFVENIEQQQLIRQIEHSSYSLLNNQTKDFLGNLLKLRLPQTVKIYHNSASDSFTQKLDTDAITYDNKILFAAGRSQAANSENMALLGHELTHINQEFTQKNNNNYLQEEQLAIRNEQKIINYLATPPVAQTFSPEQQPLPQPQLPNSSISNITPSPPLPVLKTASTSRNLNTPSQMSNLNNKYCGEISPQQLNMIKEEVYRDFIQRFRTECERGS